MKVTQLKLAGVNVNCSDSKVYSGSFLSLHIKNKIIALFYFKDLTIVLLRGAHLQCQGKLFILIILHQSPYSTSNHLAPPLTLKKDL